MFEIIILFLLIGVLFSKFVFYRVSATMNTRLTEMEDPNQDVETFYLQNLNE